MQPSRRRRSGRVTRCPQATADDDVRNRPSRVRHLYSPGKLSLGISQRSLPYRPLLVGILSLLTSRKPANENSRVGVDIKLGALRAQYSNSARPCLSPVHLIEWYEVSYPFPIGSFSIYTRRGEIYTTDGSTCWRQATSESDFNCMITPPPPIMN